MDIRKNFCMDRVVKHRNGLPREVLGSLSLEVLKRHVDMALRNIAQKSCGCPIPASVQGQGGCIFDQSGLVAGVPSHGRGGRTK